MRRLQAIAGVEVNVSGAITPEYPSALAAARPSGTGGSPCTARAYRGPSRSD